MVNAELQPCRDVSAAQRRGLWLFWKDRERPGQAEGTDRDVYVGMHVYTCACVCAHACVCACVREGVRKGKRKKRKRET